MIVPGFTMTGLMARSHQERSRNHKADPRVEANFPQPRRRYPMGALAGLSHCLAV